MKYVLCFAHPITDRRDRDGFVLIQKRKPEWQAGRFNLPGGKVERGEQPRVAAMRELQEETSIEADWAEFMGTMKYPDSEILVYDCPFDPFTQRVQTMTDEEAFFVRTATAMTDRRLIPNLKLIIPLLQARLAGWTLHGLPGVESILTLNVEECYVV